MVKNLVIVESPAKARTLGQFLGKDYTVKSSFGHIRDLPKKGLNIDIEHNFTPKYEVSVDKKKIVAELRKAAAGHEVWLASDEDREGEAIAWHLTQALKLDPKTTKRIVFHEITKTAIETAIKNPRIVDIKLVDAQQARRILDRLVGYELSPVLWEKVRSGLSAGRVQSVAVRLIVEREREIKDFQAEGSFKVTAIFMPDGQEISAELQTKFPNARESQKWLESVVAADFKIANIDQKAAARNPGAPFTTSTLQQEAARRLSFGVRQTMSVAQRLYEEGAITYMRTDSTVLSGLAISTAEKYITKAYGSNYYQRRQFQTKDQSAQEAHEAIRPTDFNRQVAGQDDQQKKLYQLIWQRTVASQMTPAQLERTEVKITVSDHQEIFLAKGEVLKFDGFMKVYGGTKDDVLLPPLKVGQTLERQIIMATETFSRPPARYSEASLVRKLEELGIGRPSTYAPTISTVQTRGYVEKKDLDGQLRDIIELQLVKSEVTQKTSQVTTGADRNKLLPTAIADMTTDFLVKYFPSIVDYDFTAKVELDFDRIADGKETWQKMISEFYKDFHPLIEKTAKVSRKEVSQMRKLGIDPKSKESIYARYGRYGPMLQKGDTEDETKKPVFAPLPDGATLEDVTMEQALEMFKLPRLIGKTADGKEMFANIGRFGPFIEVDVPKSPAAKKGKLYVSIKPHDPMTITEPEGRQLYEEKLTKDAAKHIASFAGGLQILNGPYGPYVTDGKKNARIAKDQDPKKLTSVQAKAILVAAPAKKRRFRRRPASSGATTT